MDLLKDHEQRLYKLERNDHEKRIHELERNYGELRNDMVTVRSDLTQVQSSQLRMESTILNEFKESKQLTRELINHQFGLEKRRLTKSEKIALAFISLLGTVLGAGGIVHLIGLFQQ